MPRTNAVFLMPDLKGPDGNAYMLLGRAANALKDAGHTEEERKHFHNQATNGDYDNLLATIMEWFIVVSAKIEYVVVNDLVSEFEE